MATKDELDALLADYLKQSLSGAAPVGGAEARDRSQPSSWEPQHQGLPSADDLADQLEELLQRSLDERGRADAADVSASNTLDSDPLDFGDSDELAQPSDGGEWDRENGDFFDSPSEALTAELPAAHQEEDDDDFYGFDDGPDETTIPGVGAVATTEVTLPGAPRKKA